MCTSFVAHLQKSIFSCCFLGLVLLLTLSKMERWQNRVALVTGASAGVGAGLVQFLCQNGLRVVGCARRVEKMEAMKTEKGLENLFPYKCDLGQEKDIMEMFKWIEEKFGQLDICICNAGFGDGVSLLDGNYSDWRKMMDVNVLSLNLCTQQSIKMMRKHGINDGQVLFINSDSGYTMSHHDEGKYHFYSTTKFAVTALLQGWRSELKDIGSNIRIGQLSPGFIKTDFFLAMTGDQKAVDQVYAENDHLTIDNINESIKFMLAAPPNVQIHDILITPTEQRL